MSELDWMMRVEKRLDALEAHKHEPGYHEHLIDPDEFDHHLRRHTDGLDERKGERRSKDRREGGTHEGEDHRKEERRKGGRREGEHSATGNPAPPVAEHHEEKPREEVEPKREHMLHRKLGREHKR